MHKGCVMTRPDQTLIGSAEACDLLGIHRGTLSRWVAAGKVAPAHRLPGHTGAFLFHRKEIERLIKTAA